MSVFFILLMITAASVSKALLLRPRFNQKNTFIRSTRSILHNVKPNFIAESDAKYFDYQKLEEKIYNWWESSGYFKPSDDKNKKSFVIPMPPPNVTGYLHMGHAMFVALQDIMTRYHRMRGKAALWLPGTDHAGIATQLLVERSLIAQGKSRQELGREEFLKQVWQWKGEKGDVIVQQMRRLGASADWSREKFTLDPDMSNAVTEAFVKLYEKGLIYKGDYLVNWSPNLQTAVSDLEVEYSEEVGKLYYFKYLSAANDGTFIPIATTRPETILGDTAVCVHPNDERYKHFIGQMVKVPMTDRLVPVIADEYVDQTFGTGALKITPAHDVNDYELGKKHSLPLINIMNKDASINQEGGVYAGLDRFVCREKLWNDMTAAGLTIKVEPHTQRVPRSQRGGEVIEPMVSGQWFVKMDNMAKRAVDAVRNKEIKIIPDRFEKTWYNWLENIHDWCISRQLWWGHRIPVYYVNGGKEFVVAKTEAEAYSVAKAKYGNNVQLTQDEDVLDTWFSSGLWPFATVGWPHDTASSNPLSDYNRFYPASVMETGYDILFFWVARMVMMGLEFTDQVPFHTIYMHGLVRDANNQKMSKTKGNVIDPLDTISTHGCDALRYSLVTGSSPGQDIPLSMERIESNRNFVNKLWNVGKYLQNTLSTLSTAEMTGLTVTSDISSNEINKLPLAEKYIVSKCHELIGKMTYALETYAFGEAGRLIYEFLWDEYADWYIEISKTRMKNEQQAILAKRVLIYVWDTCLRLLHPFMPYLTEILWQMIPHQGDSIMLANWPQIEGNTNPVVDTIAINDFEAIKSLVKSVRNARAEYNVEAGKKITAILQITPNLYDQILSEKASICLLAKLDESKIQIESSDGRSMMKDAVHLVVTDGIEVFLPLSGMIDYDKEIIRLSKQAEKIQKDVTQLEGRLKSKGFVDKAPPDILAEVKNNIETKTAEINNIQKSITSMKEMLLKK